MLSFLLNRLRLTTLLPTWIVIVGASTIIILGAIGIHEYCLEHDKGMMNRARILATAIANEIESSPPETWTDVLSAAARRANVEIILANADGDIEINEAFSTPTKYQLQGWIDTGQGETHASSGRAVFATAILPQLPKYIITLVPAPQAAPGLEPMFQGVLTLGVLLLVLASASAMMTARSIHRDLAFVRHKIDEAIVSSNDPQSAFLPIRTFDLVGKLTDEINGLLLRFETARKDYVNNLDQLKQLEEERSHFLAGLSHELRTPLNAILGFAHTLDSEMDGPLTIDAKESTQAILKSGEHLRALVDDILELSLLESGALKIHPELTDLMPVMREIAHQTRAVVGTRPICIELVEDEKAIAWVDPHRFRQILNNLASNAIKFTTRGYIRFIVSHDNFYTTIQVQDSGVGIAPEDIGLIFHQYRQSGETSMRRRGVGLGLSIAYHLVRLHRGHIHVDSTIGHGSVFTVKFPLHQESSKEVVR